MSYQTTVFLVVVGTCGAFLALGTLIVGGAAVYDWWQNRHN
jgi:uridine phosphorylase